MDGLRQWALCLVISAAAVALVTIITPRGSTDKTVRAVAGIFMVSAIFTPVADITFDFALSDSQAYAQVGADALADSMVESCRSAAENAILSCAGEHGITVNEICIDADIDANGCIIIHGIAVEIGRDGACSTAELEKIFGNATGVPVEVKTE